MGDITEVKRRLAQSAHDVAVLLLPDGRREGHEWRAGSVGGEKGKSLGVHLSGQKAGTWKDFSQDGPGSGGDLLDLWCAVQNITLPEALDRAREFLGMEKPQRQHITKPRPFSTPKKPPLQVPRGAALKYLHEDRYVSLEALRAYRIGETKSGERIVFPFLDVNDEPVLIKTREPGDGKKPIPTSRDCKPTLFGWQTVGDLDRALCITEGEIDALSLFDYGFKPALSVPFGGGAGNKQQWIETDFDQLERFEKIYLVLDDDEQGDAAANEIAGRLGRHRCVRVRLPRKDANQCIIDGVSNEDMSDAFLNAESMDPEGLRRVIDYTDEVIELIHPEDGQPVGYRLPYTRPGMEFHLRPGEMTIWTGATGSGKSQMLGDCSVDWVKQGARTCVASFEMMPKQSLRRLVRQATKLAQPSKGYIRAAMEWLDTGMMFYDCVGKKGVNDLLEVFDYARARYGCDMFIVDSLMRLGIASDDYAGQEQAVYELVTWGNENGVHVHLVAHAKKGDGSGKRLDNEDIKGASEIGANAYNVITVSRRKNIEEKLEKLRLENMAPGGEKSEELEKTEAEATVAMRVTKQRNGDWEGKVGLWFDQKSYRYRDDSDPKRDKRHYVDYSDIAGN